VKVGGGGAYQGQFTHHMFLPMAPEPVEVGPAPVDAPALVEDVNVGVPEPARLVRTQSTGATMWLHSAVIFTRACADACG
jgi:hypothetical protein